MKYRKIPDETIRRMPMYLRALSLVEQEGQQTISSRQLAERLHLKPPQIRKDLSYFGAFGTRGIGYPVVSTAQQIRTILRLDVPQKAALIGAGQLGTAIAAYPGFSVFGFDIAAVFDNDPAKIGKHIGRRVIEHIDAVDSLEDRAIRLAILAIPSEAAQACADRLVRAGVKGILNLAPCYLVVPKRVKVVSIDMAMALGVLPYYM
ncbi:MAG TPA: redox-sensing transcriptional repressor Rex [Phycisphaerales bacterium]|nr:redox-sensing transcriptional repressor Rex [Phycisphaerales bacterium]